MHSSPSAAEKRPCTSSSLPESKRIKTHERPMSQWTDLPVELLMRIFNHIIVLPPSREPSQFPTGTDINLALGQINRSSRSAFLECLSKSCIFIRLRCYMLQDKREVEPDVGDILDKNFNCPRTKALFANFPESNLSHRYLDISTVNFDLELNKGCGGPATNHVVCLLDEMRVLLLCQILQSQILKYKHMIIGCRHKSKESSEQIRKLLLDIASVVRGVDSVELAVPLDILDQNESDNIIDQLKTKNTLHYNDAPLYHNQFAMIQNINAHGTPMHILLPIITEILFRYFNVTFIKFQSAPLIPETAMCYCTLVMKGLSDYLLCSPSTREHQTHPLLQAGSHGDIAISYCMQYSYTEFVTDTRPVALSLFGYTLKTFEMIIQMLQARAQLELALARASMIHRFTPLRPIGSASIRRNGGSPNTYLRRALELAGNIKRKVDQLRRNQSEVGELDLDNVCDWYHEFHKIGQKVESAVVQHKTNGRKPLLEKPMPELSQFAFAIRYPTRIE